LRRCCFHSEFDIIEMIVVILLIGIVKKNAIMMPSGTLGSSRFDRSKAEQRQADPAKCKHRATDCGD